MDKLFLFLTLMFVSCSSNEQSEIALIREHTTIINMDSIPRVDFKMSDLIEEVRYLKLDNSIEGVLVNPQQIVIADSILYISDANGVLKCYDKYSGKFLRLCVKKGKARNEVIGVGDYDADSQYLYVLDITGLKILYFNHKGDFVKSTKLPFRAHKFKVLDDGFVVNTSPFTLENNKQGMQIGITDNEFNIQTQYFPYYSRMIRTPYFTQGHSDFFAPIFGSGLYTIKNRELCMDYYLKFKKDLEKYNKRGAKTMKYAADNDLLYTYNNPICGENYIFQYFFTSNNLQGDLIINRQTNKTFFIKDYIYDTGNMSNIFNLGYIKGYCVKTDEYYGIIDVPFASQIPQIELQKMKQVVSKEYMKILTIDDDSEPYTLLFFLKVKKDISLE